MRHPTFIEKSLKIVIEIGNRAGEGGAYGSLGNPYKSLGSYRKAVKYHDTVIGIEKEEPMEVSTMSTPQRVTIEKALSVIKNL